MGFAWCPKCEHLTNDISTPCGTCGGPLEAATIIDTIPGNDRLGGVIIRTISISAPDSPTAEREKKCPKCDFGFLKEIVDEGWYCDNKDCVHYQVAAPPVEQDRVEEIARQFHEAYERLAPKHGYETRKASAVPWNEVPENNRMLMMAVVEEVVLPIIAELKKQIERQLIETDTLISDLQKTGREKYDVEAKCASIKNVVEAVGMYMTIDTPVEIRDAYAAYESGITKPCAICGLVDDHKLDCPAIVQALNDAKVCKWGRSRSKKNE